MEGERGGRGGACGTAACLGAIGVLFLGFGLLMVLALPAVVRQQVGKYVSIDPNSVMYDMWKDVPFPFFFSVYLFEVLNAKEVLSGAKPELSQRGPYVYREYRQKRNITFHSNGTVSYFSYQSFFFQPDRSNGSESDYIVLPNLLVLGPAIMLENVFFPLRFTFSSALSYFGQAAFVNRTVGEHLWGYSDPFIDFLHGLNASQLPYKDKFGLFAELNNSHTGLFTTYTGMGDISKVNLVDRWNGMKELSYWNSTQCNMINGTAGEMWPPFMTPSSPVELFVPEACRSIKLTYSKSGKFGGIPIYRYRAPKTLFANGTDYPPNEGFCPCRQSGIQNISTCRSNAPIFISQPHFLNADPALLEAVNGLSPNEEEHELSLDLHPLTGLPMNFSVKIQMNIFMKRVRGVWQTGKINPVVLPLAWFSESGEVEGELMDEFYVNLVILPFLLECLKYGLVALGGLLLFSAALLGLRKKGKSYLFGRSSQKAGRREASEKKNGSQWMEVRLRLLGGYLEKKDQLTLEDSANGQPAGQPSGGLRNSSPSAEGQTTTPGPLAVVPSPTPPSSTSGRGREETSTV